MKPLELHDIRGLDKISLWPLAPGWWMVLGLLALVALISVSIYIRRQRRLRSWQVQIRSRLNEMEKNLTNETSCATAVELAELMRRLAFVQGHRAECANLHGSAWLNWLKLHDKKSFDWAGEGVPLLEAPYAPPSTVYRTEPLSQMIEAAKGWVI